MAKARRQWMAEIRQAAQAASKCKEFTHVVHMATRLDPQGRLGPDGLGEEAGGPAEGGEYEVESVIGEREGESGREFRVKWLGWPGERSTWEPATDMRGCERLIADWRMHGLATGAVEEEGTWPREVEKAVRAVTGERQFVVVHGFWTKQVRALLVKAKVKQAHRVMAKVTKAIMGDEGCTGRARVTAVYWEAMHRGRQGDREREAGERRVREEQGAQEAYGREAGELEEALAASLGRWVGRREKKKEKETVGRGGDGRGRTAAQEARAARVRQERAAAARRRRHMLQPAISRYMQPVAQGPGRGGGRGPAAPREAQGGAATRQQNLTALGFTGGGRRVSTVQAAAGRGGVRGGKGRGRAGGHTGGRGPGRGAAGAQPRADRSGVVDGRASTRRTRGGPGGVGSEGAGAAARSRAASSGEADCRVDTRRTRGGRGGGVSETTRAVVHSRAVRQTRSHTRVEQSDDRSESNGRDSVAHTPESMIYLGEEPFGDG
jgi:hypothetical protein